MQSLGDNFSELPGMETPFVVDCLEKVVKAVVCSCNKLFSEEILTLANECITLFVNSLKDVIPGS